jgi:hypothetical protein
MFRKVTRLAERAAGQVDLSRRGFLGWLGRGACALAVMAGGSFVAKALGEGVTVGGGWNGWGQPCNSDRDCPRLGAWFCFRDSGCDSQGYCINLSDLWACLDEYDPVCGCDGETYFNTCYAIRNRTNVAYPGECES